MADRPVLEAVLFDAGGTLGRLDFEWMAACASELGASLDTATLRTAELEGRRWLDRSVGMIEGYGAAVALPSPLAVMDPHPYFVGMLTAAGVPEALVPRIVERWWVRQLDVGLWLRVNEGAPEALRGVRELGLRRAVVSNSDGRAEQHIRDWGVLDELEFVIDSHWAGVSKPDPRIFQMALDRMRLPAERVLYVGDIRCGDEVGSRAAGLHFVLIDPGGAYVATGGARIAGIADLPRWIEQHFIVPGTGATLAVATTSRPITPPTGGP